MAASSEASSEAILRQRASLDNFQHELDGLKTANAIRVRQPKAFSGILFDLGLLWERRFEHDRVQPDSKTRRWTEQAFGRLGEKGRGENKRSSAQ